MYDDKDHIKVVILGESDVGKTALINRFINNYFDEYAKHSSPAIFTLKKIEFNDKFYDFDIWDICGQEKFRSLSKFFLKNAKIAVLVYDITRKKTFLDLDFWLKLILDEIGSNIFLILVGNKSDLFENEEIKEKDGINFAKALNAKFILTNAKDDLSNWSNSFQNALIDYYF